MVLFWFIICPAFSVARPLSLSLLCLSITDFSETSDTVCVLPVKENNERGRSQRMPQLDFSPFYARTETVSRIRKSRFQVSVQFHRFMTFQGNSIIEGNRKLLKILVG